jgi:Trm5-related predicted tRNA methylase
MAEDEERCIEIAQQIGTRKLFNEVAKAYSNLYQGENLEQKIVQTMDNKDQTERFYAALKEQAKNSIFKNLFKF